MIPSAPGYMVQRYDEAHVDYSNASDGYITAKYIGDTSRKSKLLISCGGQGQNFTLVPTLKVFPLCFGNGVYQIKVMQQVNGTKYRQVLAFSHTVVMPNPLSPWLYPNTYTDFNQDSKCVAVASEICANTSTDAEKFAIIYQWIIDNIDYDMALAERVRVETWWLPNPDEVVVTGKSICWGYASLLAAMCRSQSIPCKIVVGRVKGGVKHAWNETYIGSMWRRTDITFDDMSGWRANQSFTDADYQMEYLG